MSTAGKCICSRKSVRTLCYGWHLVLLSRCFKPKSQWHSTIHTNAQLRIGCVRTHTHTQATIGLCANPATPFARARLLQSPYSFLRPTKTEAAGAAAANQKQQQQWSMGPRSSASKLSQILVQRRCASPALLGQLREIPSGTYMPMWLVACT